MKRRHGRKGESTEYIQYSADVDGAKKTRFFAQFNGRVWNVFKMEPGKGGQITPIFTNILERGWAEARARQLAAKAGY